MKEKLKGALDGAPPARAALRESLGLAFEKTSNVDTSA